MRYRYIPLVLTLLLTLAACGSNSGQHAASSRAVAQAPRCQSSVTVRPLSSSAPAQLTPHNMNMGPHMRMTANRPWTAQDMARIQAIVANAHVCFDRYKDYHLAFQDGYRIFAPGVGQDVYHFASIQNFQEAQTTFDLAHPSALLYRKAGSGWQFVGVMYSAPAGTTMNQLNAEIPLGIAPWHLHVNICLPAGDAGEQTLFDPGSLFGLAGTITTQAQCTKVGGTFYWQMYGWMVHIPLFGSVGIG